MRTHLDMVGVSGSIPLARTTPREGCRPSWPEFCGIAAASHLLRWFYARNYPSRRQPEDTSITPFPWRTSPPASVRGSPRRRSPARSTAAGRYLDASSITTPRVSIVTDKDPEGLEIIRHSTAHLLANAVQELFPDAQVTIGPVIEDGFYYDFAYKRPFSTEDLAAIEKRMAEIAAKI